MRELAFAIIAGVALGLALVVAPGFVSAAERLDTLDLGRHERPNRDVALRDIREIARSMERARAAHPDTCPTMSQLRTDVPNIRDPWGSAYVVFCPHDDDVMVISAGPDRRYWTNDDVRSGEPK